MPGESISSPPPGKWNRRAVVVVLSDFQTAGYAKDFKVLRRRHDVLALALSDPREQELPASGFVSLEDPETGETLLVDCGDSSFRAEYARLAKQFSEKLREDFSHMNVDLVPLTLCEEDADTLAPLLRYFRRRARQGR